MVYHLRTVSDNSRDASTIIAAAVPNKKKRGTQTVKNAENTTQPVSGHHSN